MAKEQGDDRAKPLNVNKHYFRHLYYDIWQKKLSDLERQVYRMGGVGSGVYGLQALKESTSNSLYAMLSESLKWSSNYNLNY